MNTFKTQRLASAIAATAVAATFAGLILARAQAQTRGHAGTVPAKLSPAQDLVQAGKAVNGDAGHFDLPGFKLIPKFIQTHEGA